jgi:lipoic acid synthetase
MVSLERVLPEGAVSPAETVEEATVMQVEGQGLLPIVELDAGRPETGAVRLPQDSLRLPQESLRLPPWLRQNLLAGGGHAETAGLIAELGLETVCSSAKCPNRLECWSQKTATFMILGNVCTRPCGFCSVPKGKTEELEQDEPERVAEAARRLGLAHVVITSVTRDDLPDGGAEHFRRTVEAVRAATGAVIEVLVPDFLDTTTPRPFRVSTAPCVAARASTPGRSSCWLVPRGSAPM